MQSDIIEAIYDAPLTSRPWADLPAHIRRAFGCSAAMLTFSRCNAGETQSQSIYDTAWDSRAAWPLYESTYRHFDPINRLPMRTGSLYNYDDVAAPGGGEDADRYLQFVKSLGAHYGLFVHLGKHRGLDAWLSLSRDTDEGNFNAYDAGKIKALLPHLQRAVEIHCRLESARNSASVHAAALADLGIGAILLDEAGAIVGTNGIADNLLDQRRTLLRDEGRLRIAGMDAPLQRLLRKQEDGQVIVAGQNTDQEMHLLVRSWIGGEELSSGPVFAIYFENVPTEISVEGLRRRFNLSPSEARFAALMVAGKRVDEAGEEMGLTQASARTYCKRIFARTGARSQSDLVRLVLTSIARLDQ